MQVQVVLGTHMLLICVVGSARSAVYVNVLTSAHPPLSEPISSNHPEGHDHKVRVRISLTGDDVVLIVNTADSVMAAKRKLQSQETPKVPEPSRQRWYYSGKLLGDKMKISDINIPTGFVIQCVVNNLEFGVIRTKE